jgi:hypothetical protein
MCTLRTLRCSELPKQSAARLNQGIEAPNHFGNETKLGSNGAIPWQARVRWPLVHRGVVAQMKQLKVNFCTVELPRVVVRSLRNIQVARKELLPTTTNLPRAAALAFQIKLREISLNGFG